jgi:hypothetical protein
MRLKTCWKKQHAKTVILLLVMTLPACNRKITRQFDHNKASLSQYRQTRQAKLDRDHAVIHNNDGNDAYQYPQDRHFSLADFLDLRSAGLKGSDVTVISYCTISSSFGQFTHNTKTGECLDRPHQRPGRRNIVPELVKLGTDPLRATSTFARENGFDFYWSLRINDTHDYIHRPEQPYERWSKLKAAHPEYLCGTCGEKLAHGRWSAVDFSHAEIRDLCVQYCTEVYRNYDVDGIELDFFRHLYLFPNVARGLVATREQLDLMTGMVKQIRDMTETIGMAKGKPIVVLVRIPDSVDYCRAVGIDIETWMKQGLIDIIVGSDYFRLNPWRYLAAVGHSCGVQVYAGLSESRVNDEHPLLKRQQNAVYCARSAAAWQAGVDGIYSFNEYATRNRYLSEIGHVEKLKKKNTLYFATYVNGKPDSYLKNGAGYATLPMLTPSNPIPLNDLEVDLELEIGREEIAAQVALILYAQSDQSTMITAQLNGRQLKVVKRTGDGLAVYAVPHKAVKPGQNILTLGSVYSKARVKLLDAVLFFYRDPADPDIKDLADLCFR